MLQLAAWRVYLVFKELKSEGSRMCLWGIFQSGGSQDMVHLLEDWWSQSMRVREVPCAPGGAESKRIATLGQHVLQG